MSMVGQCRKSSGFESEMGLETRKGCADRLVAVEFRAAVGWYKKSGKKKKRKKGDPHVDRCQIKGRAGYTGLC